MDHPALRDGHLLAPALRRRRRPSEASEAYRRPSAVRDSGRRALRHRGDGSLRDSLIGELEHSYGRTQLRELSPLGRAARAAAHAFQSHGAR